MGEGLPSRCLLDLGGCEKHKGCTCCFCRQFCHPLNIVLEQETHPCSHHPHQLLVYDSGCLLIGPMVHLQPPSPVYGLSPQTFVTISHGNRDTPGAAFPPVSTGDHLPFRKWPPFSTCQPSWLTATCMSSWWAMRALLCLNIVIPLHWSRNDSHVTKSCRVPANSLSL